MAATDNFENLIVACSGFTTTQLLSRLLGWAFSQLPFTNLDILFLWSTVLGLAILRDKR